MSNRTLPRLLQAPAVLLLLVWMLVPLSMTLYFSFIRYVLNSLKDLSGHRQVLVIGVVLEIIIMY